MNGPHEITALYAYIVENTDGVESVPIVTLTSWGELHIPVSTPLIAASNAAAAALRRHLYTDPQLAGRTVRLIRFDRAHVVDVIRRET